MNFMLACPQCGSEDIHAHTQSPTMLYVCGGCGYSEPMGKWRRMPIDFEDDTDWLITQL